jgi:uncharacterized protein (TIGR03083 family)
MQLTPRYGDPLILIDGVDVDPVTTTFAQRRRLEDLLASLDDAQWAAPSRCEAWTVQDVITHLISTNQFWGFSISMGRAGKPTTFLASFDPVASPAQLVADAGRPEPAETLAAFVESNAAFAAAVEGIGDDLWAALAEAPPGHLPVGAVLLHALWDSLVHEWDIVEPLGLPRVEDPAEVTAALTYAVALSPAFSASLGSERTGAIDVRTTGPTVDLVVEVGPTVVVRTGVAPADAVPLIGESTQVLEALSSRGRVEGIDDADRWLFEGLLTIFDQS